MPTSRLASTTDLSRNNAAFLNDVNGNFEFDDQQDDDDDFESATQPNFMQPTTTTLPDSGEL